MDSIGDSLAMAELSRWASLRQSIVGGGVDAGALLFGVELPALAHQVG